MEGTGQKAGPVLEEGGGGGRCEKQGRVLENARKGLWCLEKKTKFRGARVGRRRARGGGRRKARRVLNAQLQTPTRKGCLGTCSPRLNDVRTEGKRG